MPGPEPGAGVDRTGETSWEQAYRERAEAALDQMLPQPDAVPERLHQAMRYAALGPGKRIRPILVYATGDAVGADASLLDGPAAAVELIHAYSLVHDDLPAMDDDDLRRGRPTTHRAFDEATAILAGDALQVLAFEALIGNLGNPLPADSRLEMVRLLAVASGTNGMAGGQALDLEAVGGRLDVGQIEEIHARKTGALIEASVLIAAEAAPELAPDSRQALGRYGRALGLAFQIVDDLLDIEGDPGLLGKTVGADASRRKPTYPAVAGAAAARARATQLGKAAEAALAPFGNGAAQLRSLARQIVTRRR